MILRLWLTLLGLALAQPGVAEPRDALAEALALPVASNLTGADDAPRFAWVENEAGVRNIWTAMRGQPARRVTASTQDDGQQLYDLAFSNDGASLAYVAGGDEEYPDEEDLPNTGIAPMTPPQQVFVVPADGGAPVMVGQGHSPTFSPDGARLAFTRRGEIWLWVRGGEARWIARVSGTIDRFTWSPDGTQLLFSEDRDEHSYVAVLDSDGQRLRYLDPGLGQSVEPIFSPDGGQIAFIRYMSPPAAAAPDSGPYWSIRVVDIATGAARTLWSAPPGQGGRYAGTRSRNLFWSRDGLILFPWERTGWLHVFALDATRGGEPRALTGGDYEVETFVVDRDQLLYAANADDIDRRRIWRRPLRDGAPVRLGGSEGMHFFPTIAGGEVAAIETGVSTPAHPVLLGARATPLAEVPTASGFSAPEAVVFRAADGMEIRAQFFSARGTGPRPALVYIHGGPRRQMLLGFHPSGYYSKAYVMNQHLATLGYHVLVVNYRGGTGYGQAFRDAPDTGREGASEYRDILAAGRWLAARNDVDPARIGVWGGSWGGYLGALALARDSDLFASGVDLHGVHSMLRPVANTLSPEAQERARQLQWESSPLGAIERWRSPVLLIHGDDDRNVDFAQSLLLARELAARRIPYRELVFPNERHSFFRHDSWLRALRATEDFLDLTLMRRQPLP
ncbi:prolyl oligopeptidase family serine peptidase [Sphingosinicella sp. LHD-64]|uniref:S9 family peptidase n=1 Tax=Sphingosinicella sp. LHD-64 TaxID=3072139 RepID=UPI00280E4CD6|nr:alpha/beta fold hydrolase [Sphingosinicella sp. LHD-64]MDQ8757632.1 prolyl oligopeptidase family serine peptidase [Sphingosinicella sp. LHD-64]